MAKIFNGRMAATYDGPLVVFIIGIRINRFFGGWLKTARAMPAMIEELKRNPDSGFLGVESSLSGLRTLIMIQYWRSFDALERYARDPDQEHWPAWRAFNKAIADNGSVGIFHETYVVAEREAIYVNMPEFGLGKVAGLAPATGTRSEARKRMTKG